MTAIRKAYLDAAASAANLLHEPAVTAYWTYSSALPEFTVRGLAGHLASQVLLVPRALAQEQPAEEPISLLEHYARVEWLGAGIHDDVNLRIRASGEDNAAEGISALTGRVDAVLDELREALPAEPTDRVVYFPPGPWSLSLDDFLTTRMLEISVHSDDLAYSTHIATPRLPSNVLGPVLSLLSRMSVRRHGATAVLRAFSRAERAPNTIAAL